MQREILFRGFHKEENRKETIYIDGQAYNGKWVYGDLLHLTTGYKDLYYIVPKETYYNEIYFNGDTINAIWEEQDFLEVIPETVGQYTGLDDINGKKIFEKDWLYDEPNDWYYTVGFEDGVFVLLLDEEVVWDDVYEYKNQCEIISTIFDKEVKDNE